MNKKFASLEPAILQDVWPKEATSFTPWLEDNLQRLDVVLGTELESAGREVDIGSQGLKADLVCTDVSGMNVIIENQYGSSDHDHLGKLLTYSAVRETTEVEAKFDAVIWMAETLKPDHQVALEWLNNKTEGVDFFGIQVNVSRISESDWYLPQFKIVSKPNNWERGKWGKTIEGTKKMQLDYWTAFEIFHTDFGGPFPPKKPQAKGYMDYRLGKSNFSIKLWISTQKGGHIRAELYITGAQASQYLKDLCSMKDEIEADSNWKDQPLNWAEKEDQTAQSIGRILENTDPQIKPKWPQQHQWLCDQLRDLHKIFAKRVKALEIEGDEEGEGDRLSATNGRNEASY